MHKYLLLIILSIFNSIAIAQNIEKIFLETIDSTKNMYITICPDTHVTGYMILIPGFGEKAENVLIQTDLAIQAANHGILIIIPTLQNGVHSFLIDKESQKTLQIIVNNAITRYNLQSLNYYIGGFSMGGSAAVKFATETDIKPKAVFAIDSPLDFERFYKAIQHELRLKNKYNPEQNKFYRYLLTNIEKIMGGRPDEVPMNYNIISPYSYNDTSLRVIKQLVNIPVRIYIEPAIQWWLDEQQTDAYSLNIIDCSALINELRHFGNHNAELIVTTDKGHYQPEGTYNPHSWNIANSQKLLEWLLNQTANR